MNQQELKTFKKQLLEQEKSIQKAIGKMNENEPHGSLKDYYDELSVVDNHPADIASETYEMEMRQHLKENEQKRLREIQDALQRMDTGEYGKCIICGKPIDLERLKILPQCHKCMECEKKGLSLTDQIHTRSSEEEVLQYPFGKSYKDYDEDFNGFDGEDALQAVSRFNKTDRKHQALDWYDQNMYDENISGVVEEVDKISNEYYKEQWKDEERKDIHHKK